MRSRYDVVGATCGRPFLSRHKQLLCQSLTTASFLACPRKEAKNDTGASPSKCAAQTVAAPAAQLAAALRQVRWYTVGCIA